MKVYIRGRAPFDAQEYELDEDTGILYLQGHFRDHVGTPQDIAVPLGSIDYFDLSAEPAVEASADDADIPTRWEGSE